MPADAPRVAAIVLAAGSSRRAAPANKLLAALGGEPMVRRVVLAVLASRARPVLVVTGYQAQQVAAALAGLDVGFVENADHARGIGTSIASGVRALPRDSDGVMVVLADMPGVDAGVIDALVDAFEDGDLDACVPVYEGVWGNPVLWASRHFPALERLDGDHGARALLEQLPRVRQVRVETEGVLNDVDTLADLEARGGGPGR